MNCASLRAVLIDFDGTLADSLPLLYEVYNQFLHQLQKKGSREEFQSLNGPSLSEIVAILKQKYCLEQPFETLLENYQKMIQKYCSQKLKLLPGAYDFLLHVKEIGLKVAVVSSAPLQMIDDFLKNNHVQGFVDFIVSGENLIASKPSPQVYLKALSLLKISPDEAMAIEDSENGLKSSTSAKILTLLLSEKLEKQPLAFKCFKSWKQILFFFRSKSFQFISKAISNTFVIQLKNQKSLKIVPEIAKEIEEIWSREIKIRGDSLFNEKLLSAATIGNKSIDGFFIDYKEYLAQLRKPYLRSILKIYPVAISGCTLADDKVLLGKRSEYVSAYPGYYELVPSGGIGWKAIVDGKINIQKQFLLELEEEACIPPHDVQEINQRYLIYDRENQCYEICAVLSLNSSRVEKNAIACSPEYSQLIWISYSELSAFFIREMQNIVPLSTVIVDLLFPDLFDELGSSS